MSNILCPPHLRRLMYHLHLYINQLSTSSLIVNDMPKCHVIDVSTFYDRNYFHKTIKCYILLKRQFDADFKTYIPHTVKIYCSATISAQNVYSDVI